MKKLIFCILLFSFGLSGCKASDEKEIDFFIDNNFKVYLDDDREILLTVIENTNTPSALKEAIFDKAYIKVRTVKSLLENEHGKNWVDGLNRDSLDYSNLDTLCWATNYIKQYVENANKEHESRLNQNTRNSVNEIYGFKEQIISLRDSKNDALQYRLQICK
ncbi:hypothetical protein ACPC5U_09230 [Acinetobacter haemolyticus]|uniref:Lipoprotein n=1 Tax=Acinetobacter suaedae TaxID=2609668 RepID=A0A5P1UU84_9GAMM|nr:hypothetical protein [Acinetobacter sp. C16S1]QER39888.1 hypothetical protein F2A31_09240 [Acinetobacter sp. C16S1]